MKFLTFSFPQLSAADLKFNSVEVKPAKPSVSSIAHNLYMGLGNKMSAK